MYLLRCGLGSSVLLRLSSRQSSIYNDEPGEKLRYFGFISLLVALSLSGGRASEHAPERQILGFRLRMTEKEVHERLKSIGTFVRKEEKRQEAWEIRDERFSHVIVGFNNEDKLRYVTVVTRTDKNAKRIAYDTIGDLNKARQAGDPKINNFNYQWELPADRGGPHMLVIAIGRDAKFLSTYTLKNLEDISTSEEKD